MPKADLPMTIWDQNTKVGGFIRTIDIRSDGNENGYDHTGALAPIGLAVTR
jgi:protoporphyrinogen oxidase